MARVNKNYGLLKENYLFSDIAKKVKKYCTENPTNTIIRMGIGDVTLPLPLVAVKAMQDASIEMGDKKTFKGYGDEQGYGFLQKAIQDYYIKTSNVSIDLDEIFISDGAKSDIGNFSELFSNDNEIVIPDPVYPVYIDSNIMLGRKIKLINGNKENSFLPLPSEDLKGDVIYLCSPNNPTGSVYSYEQLKIWVDYALNNNSVILFDSAYEAFISDNSLPRSIFQIENARKCCVEFCSLSKTAGFTGTRCGYTIVPKELIVEGIKLNNMWRRRQTTKYNGTSYIVQRGAEAIFSEEGIMQCKKNIDYYRTNAKIISDTLDEIGIWYTGGINSPYIWLECGRDSWDFFDFLLEKTNVVGTPGSGFGKCGEGFFRLTAFNSYENTCIAMERIKKIFQ
ncbi:MAG: LL-diaminopimelate aminotransferase [Firmicutes bacterium ADurb.Bin080]|jgi:LL-diaminopimelate aminotransferase|nr:LL-diaminopimelate aminotransferase [Clostridiales bacterium]OQC12789.1 MAG: LL-diaminopimelate aminotransferase [Firmicutes bacterium ADurb.Bin080]